MSSLIADFRYAVRSLARTPGFTVVALATIALGIGANTAIFSVVDAVLLRPLPFEDPDRLVMVRGRWPVRGVEKARISAGNIADFKSFTTAFESFAALTIAAVPISQGTGDPEQVRVGLVTPNFFQVVGIEAATGRVPRVGDTNQAIVISDDFWRRRFGADPGAVGGTLRIFDQTHDILGVLPPGLVIDVPEQYGVPTTDVRVWIVRDIELDPDLADRNAYNLRVFARLAPGATMAQAQQEADAVAAYSRENYADAARVNTQFDVFTVHSQVVDTVSSTLAGFMVAVGLVLLIACANVANLLLVRSKGREREVAVRSALGAGRGRVVRQLFIESVALALGGAALGVAVAYSAVEVLLWLDPAEFPRLRDVALNANSVWFSVALSLATAMLFGLLPALHATRTSIGASLREGGRGSTGARARLGRALIVAEVALSLVLLVGAGLLARSFVSLTRVSTGYEAEGTLTFRAPLSLQLHPDFIDAVAGLPGVRSVAEASQVPMSGRVSRGPFVPDNIDVEDTANWPAALRNLVTPGYFEALGIELVRGRLFEPRDLLLGQTDDFAGLVIIDERLAELTWPDEDPVGRTLVRRPVRQPEGAWRVVGVVENVRQGSLREQEPGLIYFLAPAAVNFVVKTSVPPESVVQPIRGVLASIAPDVPMYEVETLSGYVESALAPDRFAMILSAVFAGTALLLAAVGLYGVISYAVSQRMREMGVRVALGARQSDLVRLILGEGLKVTLFGAGLGLLGAVVVTRALSAWLFQVSPLDLPTYGAITTLLIVVAATACYLPARRAARTDPVMTLSR